MKQKTAVRQIIELLEDTKKTKCKTLREVVFFDGVLALIDAYEYEAINEQQIKDAYNKGIFYRYQNVKLQQSIPPDNGEQYFNETFENS